MRVIHGIARPLQGMNNSMTEDEFSDLFRQTAGRLHAYAVRQVGQDAADDLVSETYAIAWRRRERIGIPALPGCSWSRATWPRRCDARSGDTTSCG